MRTAVPIFLALALALPSVASADVRSGSSTDPQDSPGSQLDIAGVAVSVDRGLGTVSATVSFYGPVPEPTKSGSTLKVQILNSCGTFNDASKSGEADLSFAAETDYSTPYKAGTGYPVAWKAKGTAYGPYGSRAVTPSATFNGDRTQLTLSFTDSLLVNSETKCADASSSWNEWVSDPAIKPGPVCRRGPYVLLRRL